MSEVDDLKRLNADLEDQVKVLVRTEHRLYVTQGEVSAQFLRIRALGDFALKCLGEHDPAAILDRGIELLTALFDLDGYAVLQRQGAGFAVARASHDAAAGAPVGPAFTAWLLSIDRPALLEVPLDAPLLDEVLPVVCPERREPRELKARDAGRLAAIATGPSRDDLHGMLVAWSAPSLGRAGRREALDERNLPFLHLLATHLEQALTAAHLQATLRAQTTALEQANAHLQASVLRLETARAQLAQAQKMEAIGQLAGGVAHDFNNLLTIIVNHAALGLDACQPQTPCHTELSQIAQTAQRAASITRQLLAFSRRQPQRRSRVDLADHARGMARLLGRVLGVGVELAVHAEPGRALALADPNQVEQVLLNLVVNARDAMPGGGLLTIRVRPADAQDVAALGGQALGETPVAPDDLSVLEVADTGVGMDAVTRERMFEPFFTTKDAGRGTGLGLSVVYGIVQQTGGHILVDTSPGEGTRVRVLWPRPPADVLPAPASPAAEDALLEGLRVLVVEDEPAVRALAAQILSRAGLEVHVAEDGVDALDKAATLPHLDLLVTDVVMPRMGGVQLAHRFAALRPETATLLMTGYTLDHVEAFDCVEKPFTPHVLLGHVRTTLRRHAQRRAPA